MLCRWPGLTLLLLLSFFNGGRLEDLVIARAGRLSVVSLCSSRQLRLNTSALQQVAAMAYDVSGDRLLVSGSETGGQHRLWTLEMRDGAQPKPVTFSGTPPGRLEGMAVSADGSELFATDATRGAVVRVPLRHLPRAPAAVSVLHLLPDDRPRGLAIDETNGLLFWTNWRFGRQSIERSRLDGSDRHRLVDSDLYLPGGVAVDASSPPAAVFFTDAAADGRLRLEVSAEDGSGRREVYRGRHPLSAGLQRSTGGLYWHDSAGVWRLPLADRDAAGTAQLVAPLAGRPSAVLVTREDEQCASYAAVVPTSPPAEPRPRESCEDYCLAGRCRWDELRGRSCRCPPGFAGQRCEKDVCDNFCLAGGQCSRDGGGQPSCACPEGVTGERCQQQQQPAAQLSSTGPVTVLGLPVAAVRPLVCCLLLLLALQAGLLAVLGVRLRRAARAGAATPPPPPPPPPKRFVAIGRQLRPRPAPPRTDIEDCCQMTLCETPCVVSVSACERQGLVDQKSGGCDNPQALADLF